MKVGLRVDVDTLRGTARGVPTLLRTLDRHGAVASFFFSVGPDNMGRHLWRLRRPAFALKMLRSGAPSLYGWDIVLRGTLWPGPVIGERCGGEIRSTASAGHEIGLHAWDHHAWQARVDDADRPWIDDQLRRGVDALTTHAGRRPCCSAAPGWKCTDTALAAKAAFDFAYNSDCRGDHVFQPHVDGVAVGPPQVPVSLPTYDEVAGRDVAPGDFNDLMLGRLDPDGFNVLTVHAEVEGIACAEMFDAFLDAARARGAEFVPLGTLVNDAPPGRIVQRTIPGREGTLACLEEDASSAGAHAAPGSNFERPADDTPPNRARINDFKGRDAPCRSA